MWDSIPPLAGVSTFGWCLLTPFLKWHVAAETIQFKYLRNLPKILYSLISREVPQYRPGNESARSAVDVDQSMSTL